MNFATLTSLSPSVEMALRVAYGTLLMLQLMATLPNAVRFFSSERYGGYAESTPLTDRFHRPWVVAAVCTIWLLSAIAIVFGFALLVAAAINFALARYFYVHTRWTSILRGMGAPGHMNHWLAALILFLAAAQTLDTTGLLRSMTVLTFRVDFAAIMIAAGVYKIAAGYPRGDGFERGLVNPWWGFHAAWLRKLPAHSPAFAALNHAGYLGEILCGIGFLIPQAAPYAAVFLGLSFVLIGLTIRLTWLAEMVAVCCVLMIPPGNPVNAAFERLFHPALLVPHTGIAGQAVVYGLLLVLAAYLAVLPFAYAGMIWNFYAQRRLWPPAQRALDAWTSFFGLMLWRVFTADIVNFFASVSVRKPDGARSSYLDPWRASRRLRYRHVAEFICLASLFTTLKYYPDDHDLFRRRIVRYARTILRPEGGTVVFGYVQIVKGADAFEYCDVAEFVVDPDAETVSERVFDPSFDPRATAQHSPVFRGSRPGSYAPAVTS